MTNALTANILHRRLSDMEETLEEREECMREIIEKHELEAELKVEEEREKRRTMEQQKLQAEQELQKEKELRITTEQQLQDERAKLNKLEADNEEKNKQIEDWVCIT